MRVLVHFPALLSIVHAITATNLHRRVSLDTCTSLNTELVVPNLLGVLTAIGVIDTCLCVSSIPNFLQTNVVAILAVTIADEPIVIDILTSLINGAAPECYHPINSIQACVNGNPCDSTCTNGFDPSPASNPTDCVCEPPKQVCNGVCRPNCPSSTLPLKREVMSCEYGHTPCAKTGSGAYECVNTKTSLESCGGCSVLLDAYSPRGRDCSAIHGVSGVSCVNGACTVHECMAGYALSYDKSNCYDEDRFRLAKEAVQRHRIRSLVI